MTTKKVIIIGAGFSSLSAASYLAKAGYDVTIIEKNKVVGGRARQYKKEGFTFDIGPSFYWMPDVFESYFNDFKKKVSDYYTLNKLNPAYQVFFEDKTSLKISDNIEDIKNSFEELEKGSGNKLEQFLKSAEQNYDIAMKDLVHKPGEHIGELITIQTIKRVGIFFTSIKKQVAKRFKNKKLQQILEFPVLFLGAKPSKTPAFYNFMNHADLNLGTWHPQGGMYEVVKAMASLNQSLGVKIITDCAVQKINLTKNIATSITTEAGDLNCDVLLSGADYNFTEKLLPPNFRQYSDRYWSKKTFAPSALLFFVGFNKKLKNVSHHSLFFDSDFDLHAKEIYDTKKWPTDPLFYASFPSINDNTCSPKNMEAGVFLIPIAPGIKDTTIIRAKYFKIIINRIEKITKQNIANNIIFKKSYSVNDFTKDYNAYKGNAYGLANTLTQTHILRPRLKSKKVKNMYFTGQLTVPGPGVPPSIISGKIVSELINKYHNNERII